MSGASQADGDLQPVADLTYTEASSELDDIVAFFEQRDVDVDQLVSRLERATAIVDELDRRLRRTRAQVEELVPRLAGAVAASAVDEDGPVDEDEDDEEIAVDEEEEADMIDRELDSADEATEVMEDVVDELDRGLAGRRRRSTGGPSENPGLF